MRSRGDEKAKRNERMPLADGATAESVLEVNERPEQE
jgi:hypothetical protein